MLLASVMRPLERVSRLLLLAAWMALISYWSAQGSLPIDHPVLNNLLHGFQHRVAHLVAFGVLGLLGSWALVGIPRAAVWAVVLTSAFGATDEWHQSFTAGRRPAIDDWAVDTASAALAVYAWRRIRTTSWRAYLRPLAPIALAAMFVVGMGLALLPSPSAGTPGPNTAVSRDVAHFAIQLAQSTRSVARYVRRTLVG